MSRSALAVAVGIDVGGSSKCFHVSVLDIKHKKFLVIFHALSLPALIEGLEKYKILKIAVDAPPKANISGKRTRLAERELRQKGYNMQWTRRRPMPAPEWMRVGERLWKKLTAVYGRNRLIETFPTAASDHLSKDAHRLPLRFLSGKEKRKYYKDYIDACICALVAEKALEGKAQVAGVKDELGPIYF